jgi:hypothetical protein
MPRFAVDLNTPEGRNAVGGQPWRVAPGLVPGEPNEGLSARLLAAPPRLADFDDSGWDVCDNVRQSLSEGFTFAWYRIAVTLPQSIAGVDVSGYRVWFETNFDNYGEVWVNGEIDRAAGSIVGLNTPHRVEISEVGVPGATYVIACLCLNGPLAAPRGGIFMRFATLAFEATDN